MLPPTNFFHFFSRKEYAFVLDSTLWTLDYADKGDFLASIDSITYAVRKGPSLHELEEDYLTEEKACLENCIEKILREQEKDETIPLQEMRTVELARFVIEQIVPSYNPHVLGHPESETRRQHVQAAPIGMPGMPDKVTSRRRRYYPHRQDRCILPSLLAHKYLFADGMFFGLCRSASPQQRLIHFRGEDLCSGSSIGSLQQIEQRYQAQIMSMLTSKALEGDASVASRIRAALRDQHLIEEVRSGRFHDAASGVGFALRDDGFYLTQSIQPYALVSRRSGTARFYEFPCATIGIGLHQDDDGRICWSEPVVMDRYKHPCLPGDAPMQKMCLGSFCFATLRQSKTVKRQVLHLLYESKKMLTSGYFDAGMPFNHLDDSRYLEYRKNRKDICAPITNEVVR